MNHTLEADLEIKKWIDTAHLPQHIAIIMDGNGRWAKQQLGKSRIFGHRQGVKAVRKVTEACGELGISYLTLYVFSTENWERPATEISALMQLLARTIRVESKQLHANNVRLNAIGDLRKLPSACYDELMRSMELTKNNDGLTLTLALSYSSRWEIADAMRRIAQKVQSGIIKPEEVNEKLIDQHLATANMPDPELLIRTSGELRVSNYLLWQIAYSELYFTDTYWPDFDEEELLKALHDYQQRDRRFGRVKG